MSAKNLVIDSYRYYNTLRMTLNKFNQEIFFLWLMLILLSMYILENIECINDKRIFQSKNCLVKKFVRYIGLYIT